MAYIQVEASVRTHAKFLKAGPAASWLWLCGMGYCQDGLTDGFIPFQALDYLGVRATTARKLKNVLVGVALWDEVPGGWRVHDYLEYNRSAHDIRNTKDRRRAGGSLGGRPTKETSDETLKVSGKVNHTENPTVLISSQQNRQQQNSPPLDVAFRSFQDAYPQGRRKGGHLVEQQYMLEAHKAGGPDALMAALKNHKASEQWQNPKLIPGMDTWLEGEYWRQTLQPPSVASSPAQPSRLPAWAQKKAQA